MKHGDLLKAASLLTGLLTLINFTSCDLNKKWKEMEKDEKLAIQNYLAENDSIDFELKTSGLYYHDVRVGPGPQAETHDTAYMFYTMKYLTGTTIETNVGTVDTLIFPVNEGTLSVKGFDEAVTYMKAGGVAKLLVPSDLAFGAYGTRDIPSYTPLLFDIELIKLIKYPVKK
jgi:FKBP-type peptidyl-prolyl cis-trans isomerase FkpA